MGLCIMSGMENKSAIVPHVNNKASIRRLIKCRLRVQSFTVCFCLPVLVLLAYTHFPHVFCSTLRLEAQGKILSFCVQD